MPDSRIRYPPRYRYPWHLWRNNRWHLLKQPRDINCSPEHFQILVGQHAKKNGYQYKTKLVFDKDLNVTGVKIRLWKSRSK